MNEINNTLEIMTANGFISKYLDHTNNRNDRITLKDLYTQYCECTRNSIGKKTFSKILGTHGYSVIKIGGNITGIINIKSNWL